MPEGAVSALVNVSTAIVDDGWHDEEDPDELPPPTVFPSRAIFTFPLAESDFPGHDHAFPEERPLLFPSNISKDDRTAFQLKKLARKEMALRQGQANDALQAIRLGIGEKSFRFRNNLRPATSKGAKTRAWTLINNSGKKLQQHRLIYRRARQAMIDLGASDVLLEMYKELTNADMNSSTAVQEPNKRGQRDVELSWIWKTPGIFTGDEDTFLTERELIIPLCSIFLLPIVTVLRVNWIRAKSRRDRWNEELSVTKHEMVWVMLWYQNRAALWKGRAKAAVQPELAPYAHRQSDNWETMKEVAHTIFISENNDLADVFGYDELL